MTKKITFNIDENGEVQIDVTGTRGSECEDLTKDFETLLGTTSNKTHKDSFYETSEETVSKEIFHGNG